MKTGEQSSSSPLQQLDTLLVECSKGWDEESQLKEARAAVDALLSQVARIAGVDRAAVEAGLANVQIRQRGATTRLRTGGGFGHGPLDDIFPHDCHITIVLCNPLPWGPQVCVEIELPWPCGPV